MSTIINIIATDLMNYLLHCSNGNMLVIRVYLKPLLGALACVNEKSPVHIATTTPGRFMVKGVQNGTEITTTLHGYNVQMTFDPLLPIGNDNENLDWTLSSSL
jgi:hypothetical protein